MEKHTRLVQKPPFTSWQQSNLDPDAETFDAEAWMRAVSECRRLETLEEELKTGGYIFRNLSVSATLSTTDGFKSVSGVAIAPFRYLKSLLVKRANTNCGILHRLDGYVKDGEMLAVLGRSGSGCTTLLKVLAGAAPELQLSQESEIQYQGISPRTMHHEFRGQCIYTAESDTHFPELTVWETVKLATSAKCPKGAIAGMKRSEYLHHVTSAILRMFNLTSVKNTKVGNNLVRGVSGGERRRVTIAEAFASFSPLQFWDNTTRGMDSATALQCVKTFQQYTLLNGATTTLSLYQASQSILDCFDKVTVLYDGQQIFFGTWIDALEFFESLGFRRPQRCTTGDFLTALTNPVEAQSMIIPGWSLTIPISADDFAEAWRNSKQRRRLSEMIEQVRAGWKVDNGKGHSSFRRVRDAERSSSLVSRPPYVIGFHVQLRLCLRRGIQRLSNNSAVPISFVMGNAVMGVIIGSVFFDLGNTADDIPKRSVLLFFSILVNAFMSGFEVLAIWSQRPIVAKHDRQALYSPIVEAVSSMLCDMPAKVAASLCFNCILYFMSNLHHTGEAFFVYWLFSFACLMTMSMFFRCIGSIGRTHDQIMVPIGIVIMLCIIYAGYIIPVPYMKPWLSWYRWINPVAYAFESLVINEFHNRQFQCTRFIPSGPLYSQIPKSNQRCVFAAATVTNGTVDGNEHIHTVYGYKADHLWRNLGIICAFMILFCVIHILTSRRVALPREKRQLLQHLYQAHSPFTLHDEECGKVPEGASASPENVHSDSTAELMRTSGAHIQWKGISYTISLGRHEKKILDNIDGFVEPGTLTALMGATGAGKTTLLDVLSNRTTVGVVRGSILVNGNPPDDTYQRRTGYAQQADYHLPTTTVKEALRFSAEIRQHRSVTESEKLKHADNILNLVGLGSLSDVIVGSLNVEQRKRLTIGIELAAKPDLVLFLDEPTSGLDSQTAFTICDLLVKIARAGHTIMCTIHQPSAAILEMFDRLLLIEKGGRTVYFGDVGTKASKMIEYFECRGARACEVSENPAEWMLEITGATSQARNTKDWHEAWLASTDCHQLKHKLSDFESSRSEASCSTHSTKGEFAVSFASQLDLMLRRTIKEYWRTPEPLYAKFLFYCGATIAIGASCYQSSSSPSIQGLQNLVFSLFLLFTTFSNVMQKIVPQFSGRRALFEARERASKTFSWQAFMVSSILVEAFWQVLLAVMSFLIMYYLTGFQLYTTSSDQAERGGLMLLVFISFFLFTSSLSHVLIAGVEENEAAVNIGQLLFYLMLIFCGAIKTKAELPRFWIFMYRVSPLTYMLRSMFAVGVVGRPIHCSASEVVLLPANPGMSCGEYLEPYIFVAGGRVENPSSKSMCQYCPLATTDEFLTIFNMAYGEVARDIGIIFGFITFNIAACLFIYWLARVPKQRKSLI